MTLNFSYDRLLAVVAHPDDAELLCAGTLARARKDGAAIAICVLCRGDKGQPATPVRNLATVRRREMSAAASLLKAELICLGALDSTLADNQPTRRKVTEVFRRFGPTLVLAHAPEDYHPDHRAAAALAEAASWFCASRGYSTKSPALAAAPALWWMDTIGLSGFQPGFYIDVSIYLTLKEQMLACHRTQLARAADRDFSPLTELMRRQCQIRGLQAGVPGAEAFRANLSFKRGRAW